MNATRPRGRSTLFCSKGAGNSDYKGYEDEVQALQDQARALEQVSEDLKKLREAVNIRQNEPVN